MNKRDLRIQYKKKLQHLSVADRVTLSEQLCKKVATEKTFIKAPRINGFFPLPHEINIQPLLKQALEMGKIVCVPKALNPPEYRFCMIRDVETIQQGKWNVPEPVYWEDAPASTSDLTLVPGLAFDVTGGRLGHGAGIYDRLLATTTGVFWGVGYPFQLCDSLPSEPHDIGLNQIVVPH